MVSDPTPWLHWEANSEQRHPLYFGSTPRDLVLGRVSKNGSAVGLSQVGLPSSLRTLALEQLQVLVPAIYKKNQVPASRAIEIEMWPAANDLGQRTWVYARWRAEGTDTWRWLRDNLLSAEEQEGFSVAPELPVRLRSWMPKERKQVLADVLELGLYDKPAFGNCVLTNANETSVDKAWPPFSFHDTLAKKVKPWICHAMSQVPRVQGEPVGFVYSTSEKDFTFPASIVWEKEAAQRAAKKVVKLTTEWPANFLNEYRDDVLRFAGETEVDFPSPQDPTRFTLKNNITPRNQLMQVVEYLEERYQRLDIKTVRQTFKWRGAEQANLIAIIPGSLPPSQNQPVLLADHIDTAFCQEIFDKTGQRVAAPGADDNASATAALLRAAEMFGTVQPLHDIWLVHLTGEEFPADDLGARYLVSSLLREKKQIRGLVLLDMIGYRTPGDKVFQINPGQSAESVQLGALTVGVAQGLAQEGQLLDLKPVLRPRFDAKGYLYNTDGLIFSDAGFPVVLINEHINAYENLERPYYHEEGDVSAHLDFEFATALARVAIQTVKNLAY